MGECFRPQWLLLFPGLRFHAGLEHLNAVSPLVVSAAEPTLKQLQRCWRRKQRMPLLDVWRSGEWRLLLQPRVPSRFPARLLQWPWTSRWGRAWACESGLQAICEMLGDAR